MRNFDERWSDLAARARTQEAPPGDESAPTGFASRVVARAAASRREGAGAEDLWLQWARRSLAGMALVGLVLGSLEVRAGRPHDLRPPGVENSVAQVLWTL
ncbi:MAG: hypothetical protein JNL10_19420 [Verrucomicrobiales bacterium]|nr:hypothetical protein [Verrucomicrobiales bacterium]